ncbi:MAG: alpha/beta fold hydrolase [Chitinophagales bacterium]|nr:alpha/beta fold hydrolase [Chitinophagales bacterium]MCZ2392796.1 alpha/beta fold hydrolase [Chitinophagales bacterium]
MELNYKVLGDVGEDVILIHGLLGSLDNLHTFGKKISKTYRVWLLDMRNHGHSPHSNEMSYDIMAADVRLFMQQHDIGHSHLIGHSMGGKVAMTFALTYPEMTDRLIVIDIGPKAYAGDHLTIMKAMLSIHTTEYTERSQIEKEFYAQIPSKRIVQLMMKNIGRNSEGFYWKPNVKVLYEKYRQMMDDVPIKGEFVGKTSFIKGADSDYIEVEDLDRFRVFFPEAQLYVVPNAGHWVHADQPEYFYQLVCKILED